MDIEKDGQLTLFQDNPDYEAFVEKFTQKKTTDDCYTPPEIYRAVVDYVVRRFGIDPGDIVRPFFPGGDYERFPYPDGCVVLDNPPFSILAEICRFYVRKNIRFFLFAPTLTILSAKDVAMQINHIVSAASVVYQNGAEVPTSFVTNLTCGIVAEASPELTDLINKAVKQMRQDNKKALPKYSYPKNVITAAILQKYARNGVPFQVPAAESRLILALDSQRAYGKAIFGHGLLVSDRLAQESADAERLALLQAQKNTALPITWELSEHERFIIKKLNGGGVNNA